MIYWFGHIFWVLVSKLCFPCYVKGLQNLPSGGFIFASNHISNLDPMIIGISSRLRLSYMAKDSLFRNKGFAWLLHQVGAFSIKRGTADVGALKEALKRLKKGCPVVIFPEGTRRKFGTEGEAQSGIGFLAVKSGLPVVPVFLDGSDKALPPGTRFFKRHPVQVRFGVPVTYFNQDPYPVIAQKILQQIQTLSSEFSLQDFR